ncbi:MAG: 50S ribosomal protein L25/general stress protein Ctc [Bacteroidales bacterium]|nr:50S ribosomal protein L25/general stress protein Ctc [Bacteroidales bacterium]
MKHFEIKANLRTDLGKKASKQIRKGDNIPCVIYGGENVVHFYTNQADVRKFIYTPEVMFADIDVDGKKYVSMVKDIQFHPVSDKIIHIDFYEVNPEKPVKIKIPMKVVGNSPGVKAGGKLKQNVKRLAVKGLMNDIPDFFEVSINTLKIGQAIKVKDLKSDKLEFVDPKANILVTVVSTRGAAAVEETEEETEESAE